MNTESGTELHLAFDYGTRRIGVAIGERRLGTARPLQVIRNHNGRPDWQDIDTLMQEWQPSALIVGWPLTESGEEQPLTAHVRGFIRRLTHRYHCPVYKQDERFSSMQAESHMKRMRSSGQRRKRSTHEDIDKLSAAVILDAWFAREAGAPSRQAEDD